MISQPLLQRFVVTTKLDGIAYDVDFSKQSISKLLHGLLTIAVLILP